VLFDIGYELIIWFFYIVMNYSLFVKIEINYLIYIMDMKLNNLYYYNVLIWTYGWFISLN
jgi:hypothetical protein